MFRFLENVTLQIAERIVSFLPSGRLSYDAWEEMPRALVDSNGDIWVFWTQWNGTWYDQGAGRESFSIRYRRHIRGKSSRAWEPEEQLHPLQNTWWPSSAPINVSNGDIWVFWDASEEGRGIGGMGSRCFFPDIWHKRRNSSSQSWEAGLKLTHTQIGMCYLSGNFAPCALEDANGDIWVFWVFNGPDSGEMDTTHIACQRYRQDVQSWGSNIIKVPGEAGAIHYFDAYLSGSLRALEDRNGDIWVFWTSDKREQKSVSYARHTQGSPDDVWEPMHQLTAGGTAGDSQPFALEDRNGDIWVFWTSDRSGSPGIWYTRHTQSSPTDVWEPARQLTTGTADASQPFALEDKNGDIWVFWTSARSGWSPSIWYARHTHGSPYDAWNHSQGKVVNGSHPFVVEDLDGAIWLFSLARSTWLHTKRLDVFFQHVR